MKLSTAKAKIDSVINRPFSELFSGTDYEWVVNKGKAGQALEIVLGLQNTPNPFREKTVIRFKLSDDAKDASICIFDMSGKLLKKLPVSKGMESVSVNGYELGEGMFLYSLVVNGREIDTKRMILSE